MKLELAKESNIVYQSDSKTLNQMRDILNNGRLASSQSFEGILSEKIDFNTQLLSTKVLESYYDDLFEAEILIKDINWPELNTIIENSPDPEKYQKAFDELVGMNILVIDGDNLSLIGSEIKEYTSIVGIVKTNTVTEENYHILTSRVFSSLLYFGDEIDQEKYEEIISSI